MLVITRRAGESFVIGDEIEISIIELQGEKVRIGIAAPKSLTILRKELVDEVKRLNAQAAGVRVSLSTLADAMRDQNVNPTDPKG